MKRLFKKTFFILLILSTILHTGCFTLVKDRVPEGVVEEKVEVEASKVVIGEYYYEAEDVAEYIHLFGELPPNYITKDEAHDIGWSVEDSDGLVIGGDKFGNREELLPKEFGRQYYEADISSGYTNHRGPLRIVYSNDGLIYYTEDHYESFKQLY